MSNTKLFLVYFWDFVKKSLFFFLTLMLVFFGYIGITLYVPQIFKKFIDGITSGTTIYATFLAIAVSYLIFICAEEILKIIRDFLMKTFSLRFSRKLKTSLFEKLLHLDIHFYAENPAGELVECIEGDASELSESVSNFFLNLFSNGIILIGVILIVFNTSALLAGVFTACSIVSILSMRRQSTKGSKDFENSRKTTAELTGFITESITGYTDIHSLNAQDKIIKNTDNLHTSLYTHLKAYYKHYNVTLIFSESILFVEKCVLVLTLFYLLKNKSITIGGAFMFYHYFILLEWPISMIAKNATAFQGLTAKINRVFNLYRKESTENFGTKNLTDDDYSVQFKDVSFSYNSRETVLNNVNFTINKGQHCNIQGRTGCGKTTLTKLLLGLYPPDSGDILLNGIPINEFDQQSLRQHIGYVSQNITIFHASIRENIRMFDPDISDEQIDDALKKSGMYEKIYSLPGNLDYISEDSGANFSDGETQLLACARLFLKNNKIIILDEPTAKIDKQEEQKIQVVFHELIKDKTAFIITHRNETFKAADVLIHIQNGNVKIKNEDR